MNNTFAGWRPQVGDLVRCRTFSPQAHEDGTLVEQVSAYGGSLDTLEPVGSPVQRVATVTRDYPSPGVTRYGLADVGRRDPVRWPDDDYCILWAASAAYEPTDLLELLAQGGEDL